MRHGFSQALCVILGCCTTLAAAGVASLTEDCRDRSNRLVAVRYEPSAPVFAAARLLPGSQTPVIVINPDVYFVGRPTQQWLYRRQCAHILGDHAVVREGERARSLRDEEYADCAAIAAMGGRSSRSLLASIESDIVRVTRDNKWRQVLPGPERRVTLDKCPG